LDHDKGALEGFSTDNLQTEECGSDGNNWHNCYHGKFAKANLMLFLYLVAFISANLGFINLVPFPALDGSLILVGLIESAIRRPLPKSWVNTVNIIGFVCLMGLMIYVSLLDIGRLMGF